VLAKIEPAVQEEKESNRTASNADFVERVSEINVRRSVAEILRRSEIIKDLVHEGKLGIVGAMYDVVSGQVNFYRDTFLTKAPANAELETAK
jgi:carbonic anhydrase